MCVCARVSDCACVLLNLTTFNQFAWNLVSNHAHWRTLSSFPKTSYYCYYYYYYYDDDDDSNNLDAVPGKPSIDSLQKTAILGTSHIIRKVLLCETWSLSVGGHRWFNRSTGKKKSVTTITTTMIIIITIIIIMRYQRTSEAVVALAPLT
jgi:hypothetical protein